jgi:hypothetical protein
MKEIVTYFFRKKNPGKNTNLRLMYTANKIAIVLFLVAIGVYLVRR